MTPIRWYRSDNGPIAGVCQGLADGFDLPVGVMRMGFILVTLFGGSGLLAYFVLALALPRKDRLDTAMQSKVLGVCASLSRRLEIEVGLVRILALTALVFSLGLAVLAYVGGYFLLPEDSSTTNIHDVNG